MAPGWWPRLLRVLLFAALLGPSTAFVSSPGEPRSPVRVLCGSNWSLVLQGQWMLELGRGYHFPWGFTAQDPTGHLVLINDLMGTILKQLIESPRDAHCCGYAPWCPACQQIESTWESFAKESEHLGITVAKVDVTQEPGLSGRFFVTTLPTIYHANDGVFRRYRGSRTLEDLQGYILERKWEAVEPVAGWKSPSSIMMHGMAGLFHFSGWIRQIHNYLTGTLGVHVWVSYAIFILATLLIGLFLGLILVLISDCLCPTSSKHKAETPEEAVPKGSAEGAEPEELEEPTELPADDADETAEGKDLSDGGDAANSSAEDSEEDLALGKESGEEETEELSEQPLAESETESSVRQRRSQVAEREL